MWMGTICVYYGKRGFVKMLTEKRRTAHAETIGAGQTEDCGSARREDRHVTSVFAFLLLILFLAALELSPVAGVGALTTVASVAEHGLEDARRGSRSSQAPGRDAPFADI